MASVESGEYSETFLAFRSYSVIANSFHYMCVYQIQTLPCPRYVWYKTCFVRSDEYRHGANPPDPLQSLFGSFSFIGLSFIHASVDDFEMSNTCFIFRIYVIISSHEDNLYWLKPFLKILILFNVFPLALLLLALAQSAGNTQVIFQLVLTGLNYYN